MGQVCLLGRPPASETVLNHGDWFDIAMNYKRRPDMPNANNFHAVAIRGILDETRLRSAVDDLQARHPRMRARFYMNPLTDTTYLLETQEKIPLLVRDGTYSTINIDLEQALMRPIYPNRGPFCHVTYVRHQAEGTGLLVFCNNHGVGDGRCCEVVLSQLLKLYDGQEVPFFRNARGMFQLVGSSARAEKLEAWRRVEAEMAPINTDSVVETLVEPLHPSYAPKFEGVCLELLTFEPEEAQQLLTLCRREGTTVTGAIAAATQYAILAEMLLRGRTTELVGMGIDMNLRGRKLGPEFDQECGNFVVASKLRVPFEDDFWSAARKFTDMIKRIVDEDCSFEGMLSDYGDFLSMESLMMMQDLSNAALAAMEGSLEHCNFSSLGVLKHYGKYGEFEVLENFTASNIGFGSCKVNLCTSGASGRLTVTVMVAKNVVPHARQAACQLRDCVGRTVRGLMAPADSEDLSTTLRECSVAAQGMKEAAAARVAKIQGMKQGKLANREGHIFLGDASGNSSCITHVWVAVSTVCTVLATGVLAGWPLVQPTLREAGVFNYACEPQQHVCSAQDDALSLLYEISMYVTLILFMVCGTWFDFVGPRLSSVIGALASSISLFGIGVACALDAKTYPWSQWASMYFFCIMADMGGFLASMSLMGWLWHYPMSQTFLIGLSNGTAQSAAAMGTIVPALVARGVGVSTSFMLLATSAALAAIGLHFSTPSQADFYEQAARVLNVRVDSITAGKPSWYALKHQMKSLWSILFVFPLLNFLVYFAIGFGTVGYMRWMSSWSEKYQQWFDQDEVESLSVLFATAVPLGGVVLNPLSGIVMDRVGLARYTVIIIVATAGMAVAEPIRDFASQQLFMCLFAVYIGTIQNIPGKWPVHFVPPHLFGASFGSMSAFSGVFGMAVITPMSALGLDGDGPTSAMLGTCSLLLGAAGALLLLRGVPKTPPRNRYDTAARCMGGSKRI